MKRVLALLVAIAAAAGPICGAENLDEALKRAATDYAERLRIAADELNRTRERIAREKEPLLRDLQAAEARIVAAESEALRIETGHEQAAATRRRLLQELDEVRKSTTYIATIGHDGLKVAEDSLAPGEDQLLGERLRQLRAGLEDPATAPSAAAAVAVAEFMVERIRGSLGGATAPGSALAAEDSQVREGTFAFAGPETFFRPAAGGPAGTVRAREGSKHPVAYALPAWPQADADAFFRGEAGAMPADATAGKALRLQQTGGTVLEHIDKGGPVAYAIVVVGFVALLMILQKLWDLARMAVDEPAGVQAFLTAVRGGDRAGAQAALGRLKATTRELFAEGLRHVDEPKTVLEERLQAVLLAQRLHFERRLPLLAVIATASPLMGLLGTVVGMVKTFALITVFGTGNAGKLSSGISEVLVATELGLAVAIPTLVVHGFLAHRIHKNLALLERHALEFATAVDQARHRADPAPEAVVT